MNDPNQRTDPLTASRTVVADAADVPEWVEPAPGSPGAPARGWSAEPAPLPPGTVIRDRFELISIIGRGSTGVVYRALDRLHQEMEDRDPYVAIKVLRDDFKRRTNALVTLQREVRRAQTLAHENIVRVYSFERDGELVFMTMELLDGRSLRELIREHATGLPVAEAVPMIAGIAAALAHAHKYEIVHSDLSPGNIYRTGDGRIKVLDFGVARGVQRESHGDGRTTDDGLGDATARSDGQTSSDGTTRGDGALAPGYFDGAHGMTPAYASPQMVRGDDPQPADDVFALGILAHELLTGRHPFDGAPPDPDVPRTPDVHALRGLSRRQKNALTRALEHDRELRHENAAEFLEDFLRSARVRTAAQVGIAAAIVAGVVAVAALRDGAQAPAVAFEDLPATVQARVDEAIAEGRTALRFGDAGLNDAYAYFSQAYDLHPDNARAIDGLEDVADGFLGSIRTLDVGTQRDILELLRCQAHLAAYPPVMQTCATLFGEECASIGRQCTGSPLD